MCGKLQGVFVRFEWDFVEFDAAFIRSSIFFTFILTSFSLGWQESICGYVEWIFGVTSAWCKMQSRIDFGSFEDWDSKLCQYEVSVAQKSQQVHKGNHYFVQRVMVYSKVKILINSEEDN